MATNKHCAIRLYRGGIIATTVSCLFFADSSNNYTVQATDEDIVLSEYGRKRTLRIHEGEKAVAVYVMCIRGIYIYNILIVK